MQTEKILTFQEYQRLLKTLRLLLKQREQLTKDAEHWELIKTYWSIGKAIVQSRLTEKSKYRESITENLAKALKINKRTINHSILFYKQYCQLPKRSNLTWSHYRLIMSIPDPNVRSWYESYTKKKNLSRDELVAAIKENRHQQAAYFKREGTINLPRPTEPTYIYKAFVYRVIDGDTLILQIDLGFHVLKQQRVRLASIDAAPIHTAKGKKAYTYLRDRVATVDFIVIKTYKVDLHGRYIGHIFYKPGEKNFEKVFKEGIYLNQELVEKGFVRLM